jgi:hypothetical protein
VVAMSHRAAIDTCAPDCQQLLTHRRCALPPAPLRCGGVRREDHRVLLDIFGKRGVEESASPQANLPGERLAGHRIKCLT